MYKFHQTKTARAFGKKYWTWQLQYKLNDGQTAQLYES